LTTCLKESREAEPFRFALRRQTREEHQVLDEHEAFAALQHGSLALERYSRLMAALHAFYLGFDPAVERACHEHAALLGSFSPAARGPILARDLGDLGLEPAPPAVDATMPAIASPGALGGFLYVSEGSVLGGAMLCGPAEALLAEAGIARSHYWRWCRKAGPARWRATCDLLERLSAEEDVRQEMVLSARRTFARFAAFLGDV